MNDMLNGGGAEDFLHWAVPEEHAVLDAVEESAADEKPPPPSLLIAGPLTTTSVQPFEGGKSDEHLSL